MDRIVRKCSPRARGLYVRPVKKVGTYRRSLRARVGCSYGANLEVDTVSFSKLARAGCTVGAAPMVNVTLTHSWGDARARAGQYLAGAWSQ